MVQMTISIWIKDFPLSPSQNACIRPSAPRPGQKPRLIKTEEYARYRDKVDRWRLRYVYALQEISEKLEHARAHDPLLLFKVEMYFYFLPERIQSKKGIPLLKRNDVDNFIKPTTDALVKCIGVDDSLFWHRTAVKLALPEGDLQERTIIRIQDYRMGLDNPILKLATIQQGGKNGKAAKSTGTTE